MSQLFDPNAAAGADSGIFGLPYSYEESKLIYLPVPWEATTSYGGGTSGGPTAVFKASKQVDLFDLELGRFYEQGLFWMATPQEFHAWNTRARAEAQKIIQCGGQIEGASSLQTALDEVNGLSEKVNELVYQEAKKVLSDGKTAALVGGDHSCPFGLMRACLETYPAMGVLHFDAHADLRNAYEGFEHSHASIMFNILKSTSLRTLVQVGIRDFCEEEFNLIQDSGGRVQTYFDQKLFELKSQGTPWADICNEIIRQLPQEVYISFDIDGLDPLYCPHTGTPVPGGLGFSEAAYLIKRLAQSGRTIVGFDLNEVAPGPEGDEWDANVGARLLYKMSGWTLFSQTPKASIQV